MRAPGRIASIATILQVLSGLFHLNSATIRIRQKRNRPDMQQKVQRRLNRKHPALNTAITATILQVVSTTFGNDKQSRILPVFYKYTASNFICVSFYYFRRQKRSKSYLQQSYR